MALATRLLTRRTLTTLALATRLLTRRTLTTLAFATAYYHWFQMLQPAPQATVLGRKFLQITPRGDGMSRCVLTGTLSAGISRAAETAA